MRLQATGSILALLLCTAAASGVVLIRDNSGGKTLAAGSASQQLTAEGIAATISTLAGSVLNIDQAAAEQVRRVARPVLTCAMACQL